MKTTKLSQILVLLFIASTTLTSCLETGGQNSFSSTAFDTDIPRSVIVDRQGNLGIWTLTPATLLHVQSPDADYGSVMIGGNTAGNNHHLVHGTDGTFKINSGVFGSATNNFTIDATGDVGINVASPLGRFQVNTGTNRNLLIDSGSAAFGSTGGVGIGSLNDAGSALADLSLVADDLILQAGTGAGNLGVGTTAPIDNVNIREASNSAVATQLTLQNEGAGSHAAGIAFQTSDSAEYTTYGPKAAIVFERTAANGRGDLKFFNRNTNDTSAFLAGDERMRITSAGLVGIGNTTPAVALDVTGAITASGALTSGSISTGAITSGAITSSGAISTTTTIAATGSITTSNDLFAASGCVVYNGGTSGVCASDERLKSDIRSFDLGLEALLGLQPKYFKYNGLGEFPASKNEALGVIAQEVEKVAPELIFQKSVKLHPEDQEKTMIKQVNYTAFLYIVINSVKEFYAKWVVDSQSLHSEIESLKAQNLELIKRLEKLEAKK